MKRLGNHKISNKKMIQIELKNNTYEILVAIKEGFLQNFDEYYFTLEERYTDHILYIRSSILDSMDDYILFKLNISFNHYTQLFLNNDIWDLYVNRKIGENIKKSRIKSNYEKIRFLNITFPELKKMFYPYTTKKGKVSFRLNDYFLYALIDNIDLEKDKVLFSGYFNFPPLYKTNDYEVEDLKLIIVSNRSQNEIEVPVECYSRQDIYEKYNGNKHLMKCGFKGAFDFINHIYFDKPIYFKFYLQMTYKNYNGELNTIRSTRIRLDHLYHHYPFKKIIRYRNKNMKVRIKPTKKSKYLSLRISQFELKHEIIKNITSIWVKIRRSKRVRNVYKYAFFIISKLLPVRKKTIVFESFLGKQYSDSPRAIYEYMIDNDYEYKMYWSVDRSHIEFFKNKNVKFVRKFSIKWLFLMARAEFWVSNSRLPLWIPKPKHTTYIQTWHGTPLKRLAADMEEVHMPGTNTTKYKRNFLKEASRWDYLVSPNAYSTKIFRRAFKFDKTVIESGYPRNDFLINENNEQTILEIKQKCHLPLNKKVILYAPTWRDNQFYRRGEYKFSLQMDLETMRDKLGDNYIILLRLHYLVAENLDLTGYEDFIYDLSKHEDIRELYLISDLLITDYSSVFFDYANLKRPMIFFVYDIEEYRDNLRGFYFDFEEKAPGPLVKTTDEILEVIKDIENNGYNPSEEIQEFHKRFCYLEDGCASKRVVEKIFNK